MVTGGVTGRSRGGHGGDHASCTCCQEGGAELQSLEARRDDLHDARELVRVRVRARARVRVRVSDDLHAARKLSKVEVARAAEVVRYRRSLAQLTFALALALALALILTLALALTLTLTLTLTLS